MKLAKGSIFVPGDYHVELGSGAYLDLANPDPAAITLEDVAYGLSQTCRYNGQSRCRFYSVAEHALLVSRRLMFEGAPLRVQLAGLHHDDAEAFVGDSTRPLKRLVPGLLAVEAKVFAAVQRALNLVDLPFDDARIKAADDWALAAEAYHLLPSRGKGWFCDGLYEPIELLSPHRWTADVSSKQARSVWLERHMLLEKVAV